MLNGLNTSVSLEITLIRLNSCPQSASTELRYIMASGSDNMAENEVQFILFKVDYRKLGEDLLRRIEGDELYWKRNDAKLRAVTQAQCYEEFRQVVLAAHLTPLKPAEKSAMFNPSDHRVLWNSTATTKGAEAGGGDKDKTAAGAEDQELSNT